MRKIIIMSYIRINNMILKIIISLGSPTCSLSE